MKYIMYETVTPVIFPTSWDHSTMHQMVMSQYPGLTATSAGYVNADDDVKVYCHRDSFTMKLKPAERDAEILARMIERK